MSREWRAGLGQSHGQSADGQLDDDAATNALADMTARLERLAQETSPRPSPGFADRVYAAIAAEPMPVPTAAASRAIRHGSAIGLLAALRDSLRVAFGGRRPAAARAGALALLLAAAITSLSFGGAVAVGAAAILRSPPHTTPHRVPVAASPSPSPSPSPSATARAELSPTLEASPSVPRSPDQSSAATESPRRSPDQTSEPSSSDGHGSDKSPRPSDPDGTPRPTK